MWDKYVGSIICCVMLALAHAHTQHAQDGAANPDWATRHMAEEHHINSFDPTSFFLLHDYDASGYWAPDDIRRTYGLLDESNKHLSEEKKQEVVRRVLDLFDADRSGTISQAEYTAGLARGLLLPDFGYGPGHHEDDEYEYEIHHFEKYHGDDAKEEDLTHPEDIAHFRKHDADEAQAEAQALADKLSIIEANIPSKFRADL